MEPKVLDFEPHLALFVEDADPLVFYRKIGHLAIRLLKKGGLVYVEINSRLGKETVQTLEDCSFSEISLFRDINGHERYIRARR
jgi:release factor glutamine methyltransferase